MKNQTVERINKIARGIERERFPLTSPKCDKSYFTILVETIQQDTESVFSYPWVDECGFMQALAVDRGFCRAHLSKVHLEWLQQVKNREGLV